MPQIQWVQPFLDSVPIPRPGTNWGRIQILRISDRGWSQRRETTYDDTTGIITDAWDVQRIYSIQIDFFGPDALDNATVFKQTLQVGLTSEFGVADLKAMSEIRNLTELMENTAYLHRYSFDIDVFVVDTITKTAPAIESATVTIVNRGNNSG